MTVRLVPLAVFACLGACAAKPAAGSASVELLFAPDERANAERGAVALPSATYESVVRFDLPGEEHRLLRARVHLGGTGRVRFSLYGPTPLDGPGDALVEIVRDVAAAESSDGGDGRWLVFDLGAQKPRRGVVFVGIRRESGDLKIWAEEVDSGRAFVRDLDPKNVMGLAPVRRTPRVRLEVAP